jgi:hypothetical protein
MSNITSNTTKNAHLIAALVVVVPVALGYGFLPSFPAWGYLDIPFTHTDVPNIFRAQMGLYLGCCYLWYLGMIKSNFWAPATYSLMLFMGGLGLGRLLSLLLDGMPSALFLWGTFAELGLASYAFYQLKKHKNPSIKY